jgi:hypothetical protein
LVTKVTEEGVRDGRREIRGEIRGQHVCCRSTDGVEVAMKSVL